MPYTWITPGLPPPRTSISQHSHCWTKLVSSNTHVFLYRTLPCVTELYGEGYNGWCKCNNCNKLHSWPWFKGAQRLVPDSYMKRICAWTCPARRCKKGLARGKLIPPPPAEEIFGFSTWTCEPWEREKWAFFHPKGKRQRVFPPCFKQMTKSFKLPGISKTQELLLGSCKWSSFPGAGATSARRYKRLTWSALCLHYMHKKGLCCPMTTCGGYRGEWPETVLKFKKKTQQEPLERNEGA